VIDSIREVVDAVRSGELAAGALKAALAVVDGTSRVASPRLLLMCIGTSRPFV